MRTIEWDINEYAPFIMENRTDKSDTHDINDTIAHGPNNNDIITLHYHHNTMDISATKCNSPYFEGEVIAIHSPEDNTDTNEFEGIKVGDKVAFSFENIFRIEVIH